MERPRGSEFRAVLDLLETLYQPTDLQDFKTHVISSLLKVVPCDGSAYTKVNPRTRQIDYVTKPSIDARLVEPFQKHLHEHPLGGWESSRRGLLIVTEALRVRLATSNARQILSRYFERPLHSTSPDALPETLNRWLRYHERIRKEASEPYDPRQPFVVHRAKRSLIVRLLTQGRESVLLLEERETAAASASLKSLGLSRREAEILTYTARGKTNREIGALIGVSHRTVAKHLEHIFTKLGVRTRTAAVVRALSRLGQDDLTAPALGELSTLTERRDRAAGA